MDDIKGSLLGVATMIAAIFVGLVYIAILVLVREPETSATYRAFYIDQILRSWPGEDGLKYSLGTQIELNQADRYLLNGWSHSESAGRWTELGQAGFMFELPAEQTDRPLQLSLQVDRVVLLGENAKQILTFRSGNQQIAVEELQFDGPQRVTVPIPPNAIDANGVLIVEFSVSNCVSPLSLGRSADARCLGIFASHAVLDVQIGANQ